MQTSQIKLQTVYALRRGAHPYSNPTRVVVLETHRKWEDPGATNWGYRISRKYVTNRYASHLLAVATDYPADRVSDEKLLEVAASVQTADTHEVGQVLLEDEDANLVRLTITPPRDVRDMAAERAALDERKHKEAAERRARIEREQQLSALVDEIQQLSGVRITVPWAHPESPMSAQHVSLPIEQLRDMLKAAAAR